MHDEDERHYRQWRAEYRRRLDAEYREWLQSRRTGAQAASASPAGPALTHGHDENAAQSLGRAVSNVITGSAAHADAVTGVHGVHEDQTAPSAASERPVSRSREGR